MAENGCSLEDCHTNLFALADLSGIKWRRLTCQSDTNYGSEIAEDPILSSYSKCLQADLLCAWRRQPKAFNNKASIDVVSPKELWLFWYGDEPSSLQSYISSELLEAESGSWENGISYECRTLLFKALHNLIERGLVSENFVRVGKWFVQSYLDQEQLERESTHLSMSFHFFLHGDSTVCASVDVRHHPPLFKLSFLHLQLACHTQQGVPVILSPYGLTGLLTGKSLLSSSSKATQLLSEWAKFYCLGNHKNINKKGTDEEDDDASLNTLPSTVEVIVAGVRMQYPSCYVLLPMEVDRELIKIKHLASSNNQSAEPLQKSSFASSLSTATSNIFKHRVHLMHEKYRSQIKGNLGGRIIDKSWQDWILSSGLFSYNQNQTQSVLDGDKSVFKWNFDDPTQKFSCICQRSKQVRHSTSKSNNLFSSISFQQSSFSPASSTMTTASKSLQSLAGFGGGSLSSWKQQQGVFKSEKISENKMRSHRNQAPYHRRHRNLIEKQKDMRASMEANNFPLNQSFGSLKLNFNNINSNNNNTINNNNNNCSLNTAGNSSNIKIESSIRSFTDNHSNIIEPKFSILQNSKNRISTLDSSPSSAAPSPLMAPQCQGILPSALHNSDPTMPTLSPQPSSKSGSRETKVIIKEDFGDQKIEICSSHNHDIKISSVNNDIFHQCFISDFKMEGDKMISSNPNFSKQQILSRIRNGNVGKTWLDRKLRIKSKLASSEASELKRPFLSSRFEGEDDEESNPSYLYDYPFNGVVDLRKLEFFPSYWSSLDNGEDDFSSSDLLLLCRFQPPIDRVSETSNSIGSTLARNQDISGSKLLNSSKKMDDSNNAEGCVEPFDDYRLNNDSSPSTNRPMTTTLMREHDLIPKMQDLEKMFDTDEEPDPGSPEKVKDSPVSSQASKTFTASAPFLPGLTVKDLSRMFPTPPSADNPCSESSPMMQNIHDLEVHDINMMTHHHHHFPSYQPLQLSLHQSYIKEELALTTQNLANLKKSFNTLYKTQVISKIPASSDYSSISLPNHPTLLPHLTYKSSSQDQQFQKTPQALVEKPLLNANTSLFSSSSTSLHPDQHNNSFNSHQNQQYQPQSLQQQPQQQPFQNSINPITHHHQQHQQHSHNNSHLSQQQRTPLNYDLMSPPSNASSVSRPINSIEASYPPSVDEVSSLLINISLSDSVLNIFKDQNFDSCTLCACNRNIDGSDINMYIAPSPRTSQSSEDQFRCTCAFSAIVNRRYGHKSGLFYEDELDIIGTSQNLSDRISKPSLLTDKQLSPNFTDDEISPEIFSLFRENFSRQFPPPYVSANFKEQINRVFTGEDINEMEKRDSNDACLSALEASRQLESSNNQSCIDRKKMCLHNWSFQQTSAPLASNPQEAVRLLKKLQPLLQDAIQKKRTTRLWESVYTISGPLTWKDFHLLAGRGSRETSEPKSVPCLLVGYEKEWLSVSPHALRFWDKLSLEPLMEPKDVLYLIIAPDNDFVLSHATLFFKQLSVVYEQCKLGKHKLLSDKFKGVGKKSGDFTSSNIEDEWFRLIGSSGTASKLKFYAKVFCNVLANFVVCHLNEKRKLYEDAYRHQSMSGGNIFSISNPDQPITTHYGSSSSMFPSPSSHSLSGASSDSQQNSLEHCPEQNFNSDPSDLDNLEQKNGFSTEVVAAGHMPYVVLYIIDSFSYSSYDSNQPSLSRLATLGLLRCFHNMMKLIPEHLRPYIQFQIVPQEILLNNSSHMTSQEMKNLCFSVYTSCRRVIHHMTLGRTLTGFGPASSANQIIKKISQANNSNHINKTGNNQENLNINTHTSINDNNSNNNNNNNDKNVLNNINVAVSTGHLNNHFGTSISSSSLLYSPPFILSPPFCQANSLLHPEAWKEQIEKTSILLCAYCLSEDQRFLLASVVDSTGEMLETKCINIDPGTRKPKKGGAVRRHALLKLWEFIISLVSTTTRSWRLVVGRFGRLGHGELKGWSAILSKRNLLSSSQQLKRSCDVPSSGQCPSILSACLVSTEIHPFIHIMLDSVKKEENQSSKRQLSTPRDASCTHILVYPTSATAQATDNNVADPQMDFTTTELLNEDELLNGIESEDPDMINDFWVNLNDRLEEDVHDDNNPLYESNDLSIEPGLFQNRGNGSINMVTMEMEDNNHLNLLQQPQAMGFYISTAPPGPLPQWFWSSCPQRKNFLPICFKASLHLHCPMVQQNQDDFIQSANHKKLSHPLDSYLTSDVLRYVLETYNSLSWLTMDPSTNDRRSCLPLHMLVLMQLYHGMASFI